MANTQFEVEATPLSQVIRERHGRFVASPRTEKGYANPWDHDRMAGLSDVLKWKAEGNPLRAPGYRPSPITLPEAPLSDFETLEECATRLFWIGHASFLIEVDGLRLLIDPIFGKAGGVVSRVTRPAALVDELGRIDAVLVTHGHHDHFDPSSLRGAALAAERRGEEPPVFVVPHGLGSILPRRCGRVVELEWWQHVTLSPASGHRVRVHLVPAQHWHRRGLFDLNKRLWGGFVIEGRHRIYHSGDTGYFGGFSAIGEVFGGIDAACLPLGAYEPQWFMATQHMNPEESVAAYRELGATHFVGMHWGTFDLSNEPVDAGARWLLENVANRELPSDLIHVVSPGGSVGLTGDRGRTEAKTMHRWAG